MPRIVEGEKGKWKFSTFFITINTNRRDYDKGRLKAALGQLFSSDDMFYALLRGDVEKIDRDWATVQYSVEVGKKTGFVHAHLMVKLRHNTKVQFNIDLLRRVLMKELGLEGVHIDIAGFGNTEQTLAQYIEKHQ